MIRRLVRMAVAGLCLLSLLASAGAGWLWRRSYQADGDRVTFSRGDARYTARSHAGRVTLLGPPADPAGTRYAGEDVVARLRNEDIVFEGMFDQDADGGPPLLSQPAEACPRWGT